MANNIIQKQHINQENKCYIIWDIAKTIINGEYKLLKKEEIHSSKVGGRTNFENAFTEAQNYIDKNKSNFSEFPNKRILFLTDGKPSTENLQLICNEIAKENFQLNIVGFGSSSSFEDLRKFTSENCFFTSENFKDVETFCQNVFAAE